MTVKDMGQLKTCRWLHTYAILFEVAEVAVEDAALFAPHSAVNRRLAA